MMLEKQRSWNRGYKQYRKLCNAIRSELELEKGKPLAPDFFDTRASF